MSRRFLTVAAGTVALAVAGIATVNESPPLPWPEPAASASEPVRVRIEHEVVRIPVTDRPELHVPRAAPAPKPDGRTVVRGRIESKRAGNDVPGSNRRSPDRPAGVVERTVQTIVGDGRYKPEPFPRAGG